MEIQNSAQGDMLHEEKNAKRAKRVLIFALIFSFAFPTLLMIPLIPWMIIGDAPGSDPMSNFFLGVPYALFKSLFLEVRYPALLIFIVSYYFYRKGRHSFSMLLSLMGLIAALILTATIEH